MNAAAVWHDPIRMQGTCISPTTQNALFRALFSSTELKKKPFMHSKGKHPEHGRI